MLFKNISFLIMIKLICQRLISVQMLRCSVKIAVAFNRIDFLLIKQFCCWTIRVCIWFLILWYLQEEWVRTVESLRETPQLLVCPSWCQPWKKKNVENVLNSIFSIFFFFKVDSMKYIQAAVVFLSMTEHLVTKT